VGLVPLGLPKQVPELLILTFEQFRRKLLSLCVVSVASRLRISLYMADIKVIAVHLRHRCIQNMTCIVETVFLLGSCDSFDCFKGLQPQIIL
jgi:hypothetical protein